jgi:hypothetical protein
VSVLAPLPWPFTCIAAKNQIFLFSSRSKARCTKIKMSRRICVLKANLKKQLRSQAGRFDNTLTKKLTQTPPPRQQRRILHTNRNPHAGTFVLAQMMVWGKKVSLRIGDKFALFLYRLWSDCDMHTTTANTLLCKKSLLLKRFCNFCLFPLVFSVYRGWYDICSEGVHFPRTSFNHTTFAHTHCLKNVRCITLSC